MRVIEKLEISNFRNIKHTKLDDLKELNILIGPNNCGKTSILEFISSLRNLRYERGLYLCQDCRKFEESDKDVGGIYLSLCREDFYLKKDPNKIKIMLTISFNKEQIDKLVPGVLKKQEEKLSKTTVTCQHIKNDIMMESHGTTQLRGKHFSVFTHEDLIEEISKSILYCPEGRLQNYREKEFAQYIREKRLSGAQKRRWITFLKKYIDSKIDDERYENLIRKVDGEDFETTILEQGSGVRSLVCLAVDILFTNAKIILIDEPELGLNPFAKQEFLKFLLDECKERQVFIVTQDSTFVNPILWKNDKVGVYFYSLIAEEFVKINLNQNKEDPNTFAGYLPHTVSLKDTHIYVEGTSDVYIFQILLEKYLKQNSKNWVETMNKVGIYHLCGGFWSHLLYTIPKPPYRCIVILDGDKRSEAKKVCDRHNEAEATVNVSKFKFCKDFRDLKKFFGGGAHPIYCLKEDCIEKYLFPEFNCNKPPSNYNKKVDGYRKAEKICKIPEEIGYIFTIILKEAMA
ncbi:MAG: ATP-binding protein [Methanocellales archaeon]|nr:ATP-binding protein [Methanocellales archaeon]